MKAQFVSSQSSGDELSWKRGDIDALFRRIGQGRDPGQPQPVAVTGLHGFLPQSMSADEFFDHLDADRSLIGDPPTDRGTLKHAPSLYGGFIPDIAGFDPEFFDIPPAHAPFMDPQHRLMLMSIWNTLEDAGCPPESLNGSRTGIYVAVEDNEYLLHLLEAGINPADHGFLHHSAMIANRVSYLLGTTGPSEIVNTMCSGGAVALHRAVTDIRNGTIDTAIVGAARIIVRPEWFEGLSALGFLSNGRLPRSFGEGADGFVRSEGVVSLMLKSLHQARDIGDPIRAVILNTTVGFNGNQAASMTAPDWRTHSRLIKRCYSEVHADARDVQYIEAQGMANPVGDFGEWTAFNTALSDLCGDDGFQPGFCKISTLKPVTGHMDCASSLAALLKVAHAFRSDRINGILGFERANETLDLAGQPCRLLDKTGTFGEGRRLAGLHSYGAGGVMAHILLEAPPRDSDPVASASSSDTNTTPVIVPLSAPSEAQLLKRAENLARHLERQPNVTIGDIAFTLREGRTHFRERLAAVCSTCAELLDLLQAASPDLGGRRVFAAPTASEGLCTLATDWIEGRSDLSGTLTVPGRKVNLPGDPFLRRRYWIERPEEGPSGAPFPLQANAAKLPQEKLLETIMTAAVSFGADPAARPEDGWAEIGVDSLGMKLLARHLSERLAVRVTPEQILRTDTPASCAATLEGSEWQESGNAFGTEQGSLDPATPFPLSEGQAGLWAIQKSEPGTTSYNSPLVLSVRLHRSDPDAARVAIEQVLRRHPSLRTVVREIDGIPMQCAQAVASIPVTAEDASEWNSADLHQKIVGFMRQPISLDSPSLTRARIFVQSAKECIVAFSFNHLICDGTSNYIVARDFCRALEERYGGEGCVSTAPQVSYRDFVEAERKHLTDGVQRDSLADYWMRHLSDPVPLAVFPVPDHRGQPKTVAARLDAGSSANVRCFAAKRGVSLATVFLATWMLAIKSRAKHGNFAVVVPSNNRFEERFDELVGYCVNLLPVRCRSLVGTDGFHDVLSELSQGLGARLNASSYPFPLIVRDSERFNGRPHVSPFQVLFAYQNFLRPDDVRHRGRVKADLYLDIQQEGDFPLALEILDLGDEFLLKLKFMDGYVPADEARPFLQKVASLLAEGAGIREPDLSWHQAQLTSPIAEAQPAAPTAMSAEDCPRTEAVGEVIRDMWCELFERTDIGLDDEFLDLGGHSFLAAQTASRIARKFKTKLGIRDIFEASTPRALAELVAGMAPAPASQGEFGAASDQYVISPAQERLWLLAELGYSQAYHMPALMEVEGPLDSAALYQAIEALAARHESLRTAFPSSNGRPHAILLPSAEIDYRTDELKDIDPDARGSEIKNKVRAFLTEPFELKRGPLFRTLLMEVDDEHHIFAVVLHHIICDGWSLHILIQDLQDLYNQAVENRLEPKTAQDGYAVFARWQREATERNAEAIEAYAAHLQGAPDLDLPTDFPRPSRGTGRGARQRLFLNEDDLAVLESCSLKHGATRATMFVAAVYLVLARHSRQQDIMVGMPLLNRGLPEFERLVGLLVNTGVVRLNPNSDDLAGVGNLLSFVSERLMDLQERQEIPFETLVERLNPKRGLDRNPLFQVLVNYQRLNDDTLQLGAARSRALPFDPGFSKFDISFELEEFGDGRARLTVEYSSDLFEAETARNLGRRVLHALHQLAADVAPRDVRLATERDLNRVLYEWNHTDRIFPGPKTLGELTAAQAERTPDATALIDGTQRLSYEEFECRVRALSGYLARQGVGPGSLIGVSMFRSADMVLAIHAIVRAGAAYVPAEPALPAARIRDLFAGVRLVLTHAPAEARVTEAVGETVKAVLIDTAWPDISSGEPLNERRGRPDDLAYVIYTSGSTGKPKGVMIEHRAIANRLLWAQSQIPLGDSDRILFKTSFGFDVSVWELFWPLMTGASIIVAPPESHKDPEELAGIIEREKVTTIHFVPSMLDLFLQFEEAVSKVGSVRRIIASGEALPRPVMERCLRQIGCDLWNLYGPTEAAIDVTCWQCHPEGTGSVPIGRPIANAMIYILDERMQPCPPGMPGELYIGGSVLARGYYDRDDLTTERFLPNPFGPGRIYKTGDLARWSNDGLVQFLGRIDHQVKIRGFRIECGEIEQTLCLHDKVRRVVVLPVEGSRQTYLCAFVVQDGPPSDETALRAFLLERLPDYMIPFKFIPVLDIPLTANGKIDRKSLIEHLANLPDQTPAQDDALQGDIERLLAVIWKDVLGLVAIGRNDNFFEREGDSIRALDVVSRAKRAGLPISVKDLFQYQTIAELAHFLQDVDIVRQALASGDESEGEQISEIEF